MLNLDGMFWYRRGDLIAEGGKKVKLAHWGSIPSSSIK